MNKNDGLAIYLLLWFRLIATTLLVTWLYLRFIDVAVVSALSLVHISPDVVGQLQDTALGTIAKYSVGILFVWRVVKVTVLLGSPFSFWATLGGGRESNGISGRPVTLCHIGDIDVYPDPDRYKGKFWFGAIARSHPSSDKLVRSRLELLSMALPFGWDFAIYESRFRLSRRDHKSRCLNYRLTHTKYVKTNENMPADRYRKKMVDAVESIAKSVNGNGSRKRIDGLNWQMYFGNDGGDITDDFGSSISFTPTDDGKYKITGNVSTEIYVDSIRDLREKAKELLNPTTRL